MDKLNELIFGVLGILAGVGAWVMKLLFSRIDHIEERVEYVERSLLTKDDLEDSLSHIKDTNSLILQHLLDKRLDYRAPEKPKDTAI